MGTLNLQGTVDVEIIHLCSFWESNGCTVTSFSGKTENNYINGWNLLQPFFFLYRIFLSL